jgi:uncharacterized RmlC-like cupin family protein
MYNRSFFAAALAGLLWVLPVSARADDQKATKGNKPAVVIRLASLDQLRGDFLYLAKLAGEEEKAKQIDALIKSQLDDKGLQGIGTKKPLAAYGSIGANGFDSQVVFLAPIVDQKAFLEMIENRLGTKPDKGKDEVYTLNVEKVPAPVYFRFANDYVYVTARDKDVLDKDKILAPSIVLPAGSNDTFSMTVDVSQIPDDIKNLALGTIENRLADLKEKEMPGHTEAQKKFHEAVVNEMGAHIKALFNHGGETTFRLNLDRKAGDFSLTLSVAGKPDTPLADSIRELGKVKSLTAALQSGPSAFKAEFNLALPEKLRKLLEPALKDAEKQALSKAKNDGERQIVNTILNSVMPTLKAAELDTAFTLQGPNSEGIYTLVGGVKVKNGEQLEQTIRKTFAHDETVKLDIDKVGEVSIHRVSPKNVDAGIRRAMGDNPMYVAIRGDAAFIALGDKGLEAVKKAAAVAPTTGKVIELQMALARLAPLMHDKAALAKKVFGDDKGADQFVLTLEGGKALTLRLSAKAKLLDFLIRMKKEEGQ